MRIIKVLIEKKLDNEEKYSSIIRRQFSYEEHISAYMLALAYLGFDDKDLQIKKNIWKKFISSSGDTQIKYYKKLMEFKKEQNTIILKALNLIEEKKDTEIGLSYGTLYQPYAWGVLSYEFDAGE